MPDKAEVAVEVADKTASGAESGLKALKAIAASEAFRKYSWIKNAPILNSSGDLRGMVISGRWASVFNFAESKLEVAGKVAVFAAVAVNIYHARKEIANIMESKDSATVKGKRLSAQVASVAIRTVGGIVPGGADILAFSLHGYLGLAQKMGLTRADSLDRKIQSIDATINTTFNTWTDGDNIYNYTGKAYSDVSESIANTYVVISHHLVLR